MPTKTSEASIELPARPSSVAAARRLAWQVLDAAGRTDLVDCASLVVSEMVTNGIVHAGTPIVLTLGVDSHGLRIEVTDGSTHAPVQRRYSATATTGRGITLLDHIVDQWGVDVLANGKTVWALMTSSDRFSGDSAERSFVALDPLPVAVPAPGAVPVTLLNVPLLLHAAWQMHIEALLREFLYLRLVDDAAPAELELHAATHDALTLLRNQIPTPQIDDDPEALMSAAVEPLVTRDHLVVSIPVNSIQNFVILNNRCEAALELADAGRLLTAPTQPEVRRLRAWLCAQVAGQAEGLSPTAWGTEGALAPPPYAPPSWDTGLVRGSEKALIAADESNRILAMSDSSVRLLGYDTEQDLVGRRLVDIIPPRFHQAHLAGFTMHLVSGRGPLLGQPVEVPALRRQGDEVLIRLVVTITDVGDSRIFLAEMKSASGLRPRV